MKKVILLFSAVMSLFITDALISNNDLMNTTGLSPNNVSINRTTKGKEVVQFHARVAFDNDVPEALVGAHHFVFIGTINSAVDSDFEEYAIDVKDSIGYFPVSTYSVTPIYNIKGDLEVAKEIYLEEAYMETDDNIISFLQREPLEIGKTYIIFARTSDVFRYSENGALILTAGTEPNTAQLYETETSLNRIQPSVIGKNSVVDLYLNAYKNEIPLESDVVYGLAFNSYDEFITREATVEHSSDYLYDVIVTGEEDSEQPSVKPFDIDEVDNGIEDSEQPSDNPFNIDEIENGISNDSSAEIEYAENIDSDSND